MSTKKATVGSLLKLIDNEHLSRIAIDTKVDFKTKKLSGEVVFKLLLMTILDSNKISLRIMEKVFSNNMFKLFSGIKKEETIRYNSVSERLSVIKCDFFEQIFNHLLLVSKQYFSEDLERYHIRQFDSTSLTLSSKLLKKGMVNGLKNKEGEHTKNQIKFTVGLYKSLPSKISFYNKQEYLAEDLTLRETILNESFGDNEIIVFDRGLKKRETFKDFNTQNIHFVTRINPSKSFRIIKELPLDETETDSLKIKSDNIVHLYHKDKRILKEEFRLIITISNKTGEELFFLTNLYDMPAVEITGIYKKRWDIEVFFKFIKQHLHFKHFLAYNENGIKVMMYMTMITSILLLLYKKLNEIDGYKMVKYLFVEELNMEIIKEIDVICEGDPSKSQLFDTT